MGNLIPRKKAIPVQTQRVEDLPQILIPGAVPIQPVQQPPAQHHTHVTNNFYITNPAPAAAPPPPSQQPTATEVHYHTTIQQQPKRSSSRYRRKSTSYFGMLAITAGALSIAGAYIGLLAPYSERAAEVGLIAGAAGLLGAMLIGHTGKIIPVLGLIISAIGWLFFAKYVAPPDVKTVIQTVQPPHSRSDPLPPAAVTPPPTLPVTAVAAPTVESAQQTLESAQLAAAQRLNLDYAAAKAAVDQTTAELETARKNFGPSSPELIAAVQKCADAKSTFNLMQTRIDSDPTVIAANRLVHKLETNKK